MGQDSADGSSARQLDLFDELDGFGPRVGEELLGETADEPKTKIRFSRVPVPVVALAAAMVGYVQYLGRLTLDNHRGLGDSGFDYGIYHQAVWLLSRFHRPFVTIMGRNLMGDHTNLTMVLFAPFAWILPIDVVLLYGQAIILAVGAVPVYLLGHRLLGSRWQALAMGLVYLLHPALVWTNYEQFHPDVFLAPALAGAVWAAYAGRWRIYWMAVAVACLTKEDALLGLIAIGIWLVANPDQSRKIRGAATATVAALATFLSLRMLRALNGVGTLNSWRIPFGGIRGSLRTSVTRPGEIIDYLLDDGRPWYVWQMLAPTAMVSLLSPSLLAITVGIFASNITSTFVYQHQIQYHYSVALVPLLAIAAIGGVSRVGHRRWRWVAVGVVLLAATWTNYLWGPTPLSRVEAPHASERTNVIVPELRAAIDQIPDDAVVSAYYGYLPHMAERREIYQYPVPWKAAFWGDLRHEGERMPFVDRIEFVVLPATLDEADAPILAEIERTFDKIDDRGSVRLYRRKMNSARSQTVDQTH